MRNLDGEEISKKKECERLEKHSMKRDQRRKKVWDIQRVRLKKYLRRRLA